jgi:hypothetical protein
VLISSSSSLGGEKCMVVEEGAEGISTAFSNIVEEELSLACLNDAVVLSVAIRRGASLASLQS